MHVVEEYMERVRWTDQHSWHPQLVHVPVIGCSTSDFKLHERNSRLMVNTNTDLWKWRSSNDSFPPWAALPAHPAVVNCVLIIYPCHSVKYARDMVTVLAPLRTSLHWEIELSDI